MGRKALSNSLLLVLGLTCLFLNCSFVSNQSNSKSVAIEKIKKLMAKTDNYVEDHEVPDRKFLARRYPNRNFTNHSWEWKDVQSWDEADAYFKDFNNFQEALVWKKNSRIIFVRTRKWSPPGDWAYYVKYYYDNRGRLIQAATDYRTLVDDIKVLDIKYFDKTGRVLEHSVEYYALGWGGDQRLPEKPEVMETPIPDIPVYLRVSDLPFYSLLTNKFSLYKQMCLVKAA